MRVIVSVKPMGKAGGASRASRYISTRDRDTERENKEPRRLFNETEDRLTYWNADRYLTPGRQPLNDEIRHVVMSFMEEDYQHLGTSNEERSEVLRAMTREAMREVAEVKGAERLHWVAGIHLNTDNPHVHMVVHEAYRKRETGELKRMGKRPRETFVKYHAGESQEVVREGGPWHKAFEAALGRHLERARPRVQEMEREQQERLLDERETLGRAMLAEAEIGRAARERTQAEAFSEVRRFRVRDEHGRHQYVSEADLRRRAGSRATRELEARSAVKERAEREALRSDLFAQEMRKESYLIDRVREAREQALGALAGEEGRARQKGGRDIAEADEIRARYAAEGKALPPPMLSRHEVARLQERACAEGSAERFAELERLRETLSAEHGAETRTEREAGRLAALYTMARAELEAAQVASEHFEAERDYRRYDVAGRRLSLTEAVREAEREHDQSKWLDSNLRLHFRPGRRREAAARAAGLEQVCAAIQEKQREERESHRRGVEGREKMAQVLSGAYDREAERCRREDRPMPDPVFSKDQLARLEGLAEKVGDDRSAHRLAQAERVYDRRTPEKSRPPLEERAARALAREIIAGVRAEEARASYAKFTERKEWVPVLFEDARGDLGSRTLNEIFGRTPYEEMIGELRVRLNPHDRAAAEAVQSRESHLLAEVERARGGVTQANLATAAYCRELGEAGREIPRPSFTPREIQILEQAASREKDPLVRAKYRSLADEARGITGREAAYDRKDSPAQFPDLAAFARTKEREPEREFAPAPPARAPEPAREPEPSRFDR